MSDIKYGGAPALSVVWTGERALVLRHHAAARVFKSVPKRDGVRISYEIDPGFSDLRENSELSSRNRASCPDLSADRWQAPVVVCLHALLTSANVAIRVMGSRGWLKAHVFVKGASGFR